MPGLDPMWALNHYHYLDNGRDGKRGMILSRYTGLGSQRYPAGFSGDTISTWKSLEFQPYFTATAVNAGYPWWSHDIGGFKTGVRDSELFLRWLQFGVFSVFMRLHSSNSPFTSKDPDSFEPSVRPVIALHLYRRKRRGARAVPANLPGILPLSGGFGGVQRAKRVFSRQRAAGVSHHFTR